jgi:hypothetical protein
LRYPFLRHSGAALETHYSLETPRAEMKRFFTTALAMIVGVGFTLASVLVLLEVTLRIELMEDVVLRSLAQIATLVGGVLLLVSSVFLSVRLAVFLFDGEPQSRP